MEDRQPSGLWLELLRGADVDKRAAVLDEAGLRVSTWSADPYPDYLPRRVDECSELLIGETAHLTDTGDLQAAYAALPAADTSTTVIPLRRYPRPSQGICTGEPTNGLLLVLIDPRNPQDAVALRDWADFIHLRHIAAARVPGYTMITPYEHAEQGSPRFCHLYEMTTDDPRATFESMRPAVIDLIGGPGTADFDEWAIHPALRIEYVNTFRRV